MEAILDDELERESGFVVVSWMRTSGVSLLLGYTHGAGYAMTKVGAAYTCRKVTSDTFTVGISGDLGVTEELGLSQAPLDSGKSETNGVQVAIGLGLTFSHGWHWDAATDQLSLTRSVSAGGGAAAGVRVEGGIEFAHAWEQMGEVVACDHMTWGIPTVTAS